jgi:UDP-N-acetylmuramoyl-tripeptide--D-alanyl-D-alanine ligase
MFNIEELRNITQGKLRQGDLSRQVKGISTNSRTIKKGEAFLAIVGKNFDGHQFVADAIGKKAAALIVTKDLKNVPAHISTIQVKNTIQALGRIARAYRDRFPIPVVAITGSAGKTTTKEMIAHTLQGRFRVLKNIATENNHIGVPLTLFKLRPRHEIAVIEVGTNRPGDIRWLTAIANPNVALLTNIGESHLELLKTPAGVFKEKFDLVKGMQKKGVVIFNADDPYLRKIAARGFAHKTITFAINQPADYRAGSLKNRQGILTFEVNGKKGWKMRALARHNVYNALAAISCARYFKMDDAGIKRRLAGFRFPAGRQRVDRIGRCWLIDDSYNANPVSLRSALETLSSLNIDGRRILVCGDMLELGQQSKELHRSMGRLAAVSRLDVLLTFGTMSGWMAQEARKGNRDLIVSHCRSVEEINRKLKTYCRSGDAILIKGSRGMRMERVVEFLKQKLN